MECLNQGHTLGKNQGLWVSILGQTWEGDSE